MWDVYYVGGGIGGGGGGNTKVQVPLTFTVDQSASM